VLLHVTSTFILSGARPYADDTYYSSVKLGIHDEAIENLEVSPHDLVLQFRALVLGTSSRMFTWDESGEIFKLACRQKKRSLKLTMEGYDEITTER
jgi:hypothetical protein